MYFCLLTHNILRVNLGMTTGGNVTSLLIFFEIVFFFSFNDIKHMVILVHLSHFVLVI